MHDQPHEFTNKSTEEKNAKRICIIGAGPAGLATAISIMQEAKKNPNKEFTIDLFEKRPFESVRRQKVGIFDNLDKESVLWDKFCKETFYPGKKITLDPKSQALLCDGKPFPIPLNRRQKLLHKILIQEADPNISAITFSIRTLELALKEHLAEEKIKNVKFDWHFEANIKQINLKKDNASIEIENKPLYKFDTLVVCEGAQREMVSKINEAIKNDQAGFVKPFDYHDVGKDKYFNSQNKAYHQDHYGLRIVFKDVETNPSRDYRDEGYTKLEELGISINPIVRFADNSWKQKEDNWQLRCYVAGRLPSEITSIKDVKEKQEKLIEYVKVLASMYYQLPIEGFEVDLKGDPALNVSNWELTLKAVDNPVRKLNNGANIVLVGDAAMTAYHEVGQSSVFALNEGRVLAKCLVSDHKGTDEPLKLFVTRFNSYEKFVDDFIDLRYHKELEQNAPSHQYSFFKNMPVKNLNFLSKHIANTSEVYDVTELMAADKTEQKGDGMLMAKLELLEASAKDGNDFAAFALANQLQEGITYEKNEGNDTVIGNYQNLQKSLFYWELLKERGYPVDSNVKELELIVISKGVF